MAKKQTQVSIQANSLLTAQELAEMLGLCKRQIFRLNSIGKIPKPVRIGGSVRWRRSDIELWLELGCPERGTFEAMKEGDKNGQR